MSSAEFSFDFPYAYGAPALRGVLRQQPGYFYVEEQLGFEPAGEGEHVFLFVEKTGLNTQFLAEKIAAFAQVSSRLVSYSGMKDRHAVTRQWFSVHVPGKQTFDWQQLNSEQITVLAAQRHVKKLKRGTHRSNFFRICIDDIEGDSQQLQQRAEKIRLQGFPNYFGEQRFGHAGNNIVKAQRWFAGEYKPKKHQRGIYLSAVRSWLFNQVLAQRIRANNWQTLSRGELLMLEGSHSVFPQSDDSDLTQRLSIGDIHLTGPLYGKASKLCVSDDVADLEQPILDRFPDLLDGLERHGLTAERRALRTIAQNFQCKLEGQQLFLEFALPKGCFATALVRELVDYKTA